MKNAPLFSLLTLSILLFAPMSAFALPNTSASSTAKVSRAQARMDAERIKADEAIIKRIADLETLLTKIGAMKNISSVFTDHLQGMVRTEETNLNSLKSQIDAEASSTILHQEATSITKSFRIYALVIPQARIAAAADRVRTISAMLSAVADKVSARIAATALPNSDTLQSVLDELRSKINDANSQADKSVAIIVPLRPDDGDSSMLDANSSTLKQARDYLMIAQQDIKDARKDLGSLIQGIKVSSSTAATSTTSQ